MKKISTLWGRRAVALSLALDSEEPTGDVVRMSSFAIWVCGVEVLQASGYGGYVDGAERWSVARGEAVSRHSPHAPPPTSQIAAQAFITMSRQVPNVSLCVIITVLAS